jgi:hypothetical protein
MTLDASGNLMLGATTASGAFYIQNSTNPALRMGYGGANALHELAWDSADFVISADRGNAVASSLIFRNDGTERARITSGGEFLVGVTSGVVGAERISVDAGSNRGIVLKTSSSSNELVGCWNSATSGNNRFSIFWTETSATERGSIDYNRTGGLTRYNTTSDATLKNIIGDSDGQKSVEILSTTRIREFAWKDDEQQKPQIGVIAQELYETYKGAVSVGGEAEKTDEEGNVTTEYRPWSVDKTAFTFHLIAGWQAHEKMIKEQQAMIDELKAKVAALENA